MTPRQIELVQESFQKIIPVSRGVAHIFYGRLFQLDPSLRWLFRSDIEKQGQKLMEALRGVIANLRSLDQVLPGLEAMARRHAKYGVRSEDYATVGHALIDTLKKALGAGFTEEAGEAWLTAYTMLADVMIAAAEEERVA
jgi:nitric oxide dioxygenase